MKKALLGSPPVSCVLCPGLGRKVTGDLHKCGFPFPPRCWGQAMRKKARPFVEKGPPAGCQNLFTHLSPCCPSPAVLTCSGEVVWGQGQASEQLRSLKGTCGRCQHVCDLDSTRRVMPAGRIPVSSTGQSWAWSLYVPHVLAGSSPQSSVPASHVPPSRATLQGTWGCLAATPPGRNCRCQLEITPALSPSAAW